MAVSGISDDLKKIVLVPSRGNGRLGLYSDRTGFIASKGVAEQEIAVASSSGAGSADYVEPNPGDIDGKEREYHPVRTEVSSDGLFVREYQQIRIIKFLDENEDLVAYELRDTDPTDYP